MLKYQENNNKLSSRSEQQCLSLATKKNIVSSPDLNNAETVKKEIGRTSNNEEANESLGRKGKKNIKAHQSATSDLHR